MAIDAPNLVMDSEYAWLNAVDFGRPSSYLKGQY